MPRTILFAALLILPIAACNTAGGGFNFDMRGNGIATDERFAATAPRPEPDASGLITYPTYQVAVAQRGDTVADVALRIGMDADELARFNGRNPADRLRRDEVLALPRRVTPGGGSGVDITSIASAAIDRADAQSGSQAITATPLEVQQGAEPVRHRVARGETAYSISRLYGVSVRALSDWNGLGADLTVHEGQYLIIPLILEQAAAAPDGGAPGFSTTPIPPSASEPLPDVIAAAPLPAAPNLTAPAAPATPAATPAAPSTQMQRPVPGSIVRAYSAQNEGIDISASTGTPVRAAADGEVAAITRDTDQVPILVLRHPGNLLTVYAGIQNIGVTRGDTVTRGQTIAEVGPGDPSFLHFEVRRGFESIDPTPFIQ